MNETIYESIAIGVAILSTFIALGWLIYNMAQNGIREDKTDIEGVMFISGRFRYITGFISYLATLYVGIVAIGNSLSVYKFGFIGDVVIVTISVAGSVAIAYLLFISLIQAERALVSVRTTQTQRRAIWGFYIIIMLADFSTIYGGSIVVLNYLSASKIAALESSKDTEIHTIKDTKFNVAKGYEQDIAEITKELQNGVIIAKTKQILKLENAIRYYKRKGESFSKTQAKLDSLVSNLKAIARQKKIEKRDKLRDKLLATADSVEATVSTQKLSKAAKKQLLLEELKDNKFKAMLFGIVLELLNLLLSLLHSFLRDNEEEVEEVKEEPTLTKLTLSSADRKQELMRSYIIEGMKRTATEDKKELSSDEVATDNLTLSFAVGRTRKHIMEVAVERGGIFSMSKENQQTEVHILQRANSDFRRWLADQAWNRAVG